MDARSDPRNFAAGEQKSRGPSPRAGIQRGGRRTRVGRSRGTASLGSGPRSERRAPPQPRVGGAEEVRARGGGGPLRASCRDVTRLRRPCGPPDPRRERRPEGSRRPAARTCGCCCRRYCYCSRPRLRAAQVGGWRPGRRVRDADGSGSCPPPAQRRRGPSARGFRVLARAEREVRGSALRAPGRNSPPPPARLLRRQVFGTESFIPPVAGLQ